MLKVNHVQALPDYRLRVDLNNGKTLELSVTGYLDAPGYEALRDEGFFSQAEVEEWGQGVAWPGDVEIPVTALYRLAKEQAGSAYPVEKFNAWMQRNGLSASAAARALGLSRRTIIYYHVGDKPIPPVVGLACEGFDVRVLKGLLPKPEKPVSIEEMNQAIAARGAAAMPA